MSLSDDAYPLPLSGQETSQGGLEREFMDIDDGQGYDDLPAIMMDESLLETGFEGDGYGGVIRDRLSQMAYQRLPQRLGDMVKAVIQVILEFAIAEDQQALPWRIHDKRDLSPGEREKMYRILDLSVETSSSRLRKNVKTLYGQLDLDPSVAVHPKCPTKERQNVFVDVAGKDGWDKVPDSCPECGTALREGGKLVTEFFPRRTLQAELEYLFSLDGVERLVEDQQVLRSRQRQRDEQMERPAYLQDANPGKILRHQLDGSCYQVDDQDVQRERGCLVLTINVSIDWADPSKSRNRSPRSMGPIIVS
ncbi:hypothetical protein C345_06722 [Cryptococcus neoformans A2-102-5]|nr:hypothetical protein C345_06722 [Cryptococcus neoformans var. grubii A2-102-5]